MRLLPKSARQLPTLANTEVLLLYIHSYYTEAHPMYLSLPTHSCTHQVTAKIRKVAAHVSRYGRLSAINPLMLHRNTHSVLQSANPHAQIRSLISNVWKANFHVGKHGRLAAM
eukprot:1159857-Pelagomonas_calceolata.AAC.8